MMNESINHADKFITKISFIEAFNRLISDYSPRVQKIMRDRYILVLASNKPKTLEAIGSENGITRERVRQIIREVLRKTNLKKDNEDLKNAINQITFTIKRNSGIIEENKLVLLADGANYREKSVIRFFLDCSQEFKQYEIKGELKKSYALSGFDLEEWRKLKKLTLVILEEEKKPLSQDELLARLTRRFGLECDDDKVENFLSVSEEIKKNNFGKWGLVHWKEINPRNTRDKAYLVLKEANKPLHFSKIAELIDENGLSRKKTHQQTVHNELIKNDNFVLIGRGVYALSEWGYKKGTVRDIIKEILKKNGKPMNQKAIVNEILKVRQVKKSTVMINLNNFFVRTGKKEYFVR